MGKEPCIFMTQKISIKALESTMRLMALALGISKDKKLSTIQGNDKIGFHTETAFFISEIMKPILAGFIKERLMITKESL